MNRKFKYLQVGHVNLGRLKVLFFEHYYCVNSIKSVLLVWGL